jgi:hypothetical protein
MTDKQRDRIEIRLCVPNEPVRVVSARLFAQIRALQSLWPSCPKRFICCGSELLENMTFHASGIQAGDIVVVLPRGEDESGSRIHDWLKITRDTDSFNETITAVLTFTTAREAARLRDLHWTSLNRRPRLFRKLCAEFTDRHERMRPLPATVVPGPAPEEPSTAALPVSWD